MTDNLFATDRDRAIIEAGGFFCEACLVGKPLDDVSPNPRYCLGCYEALKGDTALIEATAKDYWMKDNALFVHYGMKYGIAPDGSTVCVGPVSGVSQPLPAREEPVTKPQLEGNLPAQETAEVLLQKNKGGRPRKTEGEPVSRMTEWRRVKAEQGVLL